MLLMRRGTFFSRSAVPQLAPLDVSSDEHFEQAKECTQGSFPLDSVGLVDYDVYYAAGYMVRYRDRLRELRTSDMGKLRALSDRMPPFQ